jgi:SAM-dependent methyltransferase
MLYDTLGIGYTTTRVPDARIATHLTSALGDANTIVNVGAGTGSYEPTDRLVVAVEPSMTMIRQRPMGSAPAIQALASSLPLRDNAAAAAMAVLTVHHWTDRSRALQELARVARDRLVIFTWDPAGPDFWLTDEYFPEIRLRDQQRFPSMGELTREFGHIKVETVAIPRDCTDGFLGAFWCRPNAYLDGAIRAGMSGFAASSGFEEGLEHLRSDLKSGAWEERFGHLRLQGQVDLGYRLAIVELSHAA